MLCSIFRLFKNHSQEGFLKFIKSRVPQIRGFWLVVGVSLPRKDPSNNVEFTVWRVNDIDQQILGWEAVGSLGA